MTDKQLGLFLLDQVQLLRVDFHELNSKFSKLPDSEARLIYRQDLDIQPELRDLSSTIHDIERKAKVLLEITQ